MIAFVRRFQNAVAPTRETVTIDGHEVRCSCGCTWIAQPDYASNVLENVCPECKASPSRGRVGPLQPFTITIPIEFRGASRVVPKR